MVMNDADQITNLKPIGDGKYEFTLSVYGSNALKIEANCTAAETVTVSLKIKLKNMGSTEVDIPDNAYVTLSSEGMALISAYSVKSGIVTFNNVKKDVTYTLTVEHYESHLLEVKAAITEQELTLNYQIFQGTNASFDITDAMNGNVVMKQASNAVLYFAQAVKADEDFFALATFKNIVATPQSGWDSRLGFEIGRGALTHNWWGTATNISQVICSTLDDAKTEVQIPPRWQHPHAIADKAAVHNDTGFVMGVARVDGKLYGIYASGDSYELVQWANITDFNSGEIRIGLTVDYNHACDKVADVSGLSYEVVTSGTAFSTNTKLAQAFAALKG